MALKENNLVKPSASFANIFDAVPSATATIINVKEISIINFKSSIVVVKSYLV